jgi:hypothetical protein
VRASTAFNLLLQIPGASATDRTTVATLMRCAWEAVTTIINRGRSRTAGHPTTAGHRTAEAEGAPSADPGHALITGFARTSAEVSAAMNLSPKAASQLVGHAEALDTGCPRSRDFSRLVGSIGGQRISSSRAPISSTVG